MARNIFAKYLFPASNEQKESSDDSKKSSSQTLIKEVTSSDFSFRKYSSFSDEAQTKFGLNLTQIVPCIEGLPVVCWEKTAKGDYLFLCGAKNRTKAIETDIEFLDHPHKVEVTPEDKLYRCAKLPIPYPTDYETLSAKYFFERREVGRGRVLQLAEDFMGNSRELFLKSKTAEYLDWLKRATDSALAQMGEE